MDEHIINGIKHVQLNGGRFPNHTQEGPIDPSLVEPIDAATFFTLSAEDGIYSYYLHQDSVTTHYYGEMNGKTEVNGVCYTFRVKSGRWPTRELVFGALLLATDAARDEGIRLESAYRTSRKAQAKPEPKPEPKSDLSVADLLGLL